MKKITVLLLFAVISVKAFAQNDFLFTNAEYGVEIKFPAEPVIMDHLHNHFIIKDYIATLNLLSAGLMY